MTTRVFGPILGLCLLGCVNEGGDDGAGTTDTEATGAGEGCTPGEISACTCPDGTQSQQTCAASGDAFGSCECGAGTSATTTSASATDDTTATSATSTVTSTSDEGDSTDTSTDTESSCVLVLDDFEREELGPDWTVYNGTPHIVDASDFAGDTGLTIATWAARAAPDDQYAEGVLADPLGTTNSMVFVRRRASDLQRYGLVWVDSSYADCEALDPGWSSGPGGMMLKLDGGPDAPPLACVQRPTVVGGDVLRIEAEGTTLRGFVNGELLVEAVDTELPGGEPGIAMAAQADDQVGFESFEAGCLR